MKALKVFVLTALVGVLGAACAGAHAGDTFPGGNGWFKYERIGGTPSSPYVTYAVYWCRQVTVNNVECEYRGTTTGINPEL